ATAEHPIHWMVTGHDVRSSASRSLKPLDLRVVRGWHETCARVGQGDESSEPGWDFPMQAPVASVQRGRRASIEDRQLTLEVDLWWKGRTLPSTILLASWESSLPMRLRLSRLDFRTLL